MVVPVVVMVVVVSHAPPIMHDVPGTSDLLEKAGTGRPAHAMTAEVAPRWKILIAIALSVTVADQFSKFLAVKHLTPGIADAHLEPKGERVRDLSQRDGILEELGTFEELALFFSDAAEEPCLKNRRLCREVKVIDGFWSWRYAENKGAAWSLFARAGDSFRVPFLVGVSILAVFFIINFIRKLEPDQNMLLIALSLICGGAIGNLIDRVYLGYVIDFIDWYVETAHWPTFNIADSAISVGVGLIGLNMVFDHFKKKAPA
jgi:signal peptidase II